MEVGKYMVFDISTKFFSSVKSEALCIIWLGYVNNENLEHTVKSRIRGIQNKIRNLGLIEWK